MSDLKRRYGSFTIPKENLDQGSAWVRHIMGRVIILDARFRFDLDAVQYLASCQDFKEVELGCEAPHYNYSIEFPDRFVGWSR